MYRFLGHYLPQVSIEPAQSQPEYVSNAFVILDECSSLGLEALLVNTPVISTQALIPQLEEHIGGEDTGLFNAAYAQAYWRPKTVEEAVEYVLKAEKGEMEATPSPELLKAYLKDYYGWPSTRPSSFQMGDAILELLDLPKDSHLTGALPEICHDSEGISHCININVDRVLLSGYERQEREFERLKRVVYRYVPGSIIVPKAKLLLRCLFSRDREHFKKYLYFDWLYPHHRELSKTFASLLKLYDTDVPA